MHYKTPEATDPSCEVAVWQTCSPLFRSFDKYKNNGIKTTLKFNMMNDLVWHNCFATFFLETDLNVKVCSVVFVGEELPWPP